MFLTLFELKKGGKSSWSWQNTERTAKFCQSQCGSSHFWERLSYLRSASKDERKQEIETLVRNSGLGARELLSCAESNHIFWEIGCSGWVIHLRTSFEGVLDMEFSKNKKLVLGQVLSLSALAFSMSVTARAELVYEATQAQDRELTRQAIVTSEKAKDTAAAPQVVVAPQVVAAPAAPVAQVAQPVVVAPAVVAAPAQTVAAPVVAVEAQQSQQEVSPNLSKSEMMRRERVRTELRNEDILQERLEELRLRDEKRRTEQLVNNSSVYPQDSVSVVPASVAAAPVAPVKEEKVGTLAATPAVAKVASVSAVTQQDQMVQVSSGSVTAATVDTSDEKTLIYINPRAGVGSFTSNVLNYDVRPHFALGVALGADVSNNLSIEVGYTYAEYGLSSAFNNGFTGYGYGYGYGQQTNDIYALKQNVVDAGLKLNFLGRDAKLRPFLGGGGAYARSFLNYAPTLFNTWDRTQYGADCDTIQYLGFLSTGFDIKVNKFISVGTSFKYFGVLSSRDNRNGFVGIPGVAYDYDKQATANALQRVSFYSINGGISFVF